MSRSTNWISESLRAKEFLALLERKMTSLGVTQNQTEEFNSQKKKTECHIEAPPLRYFFLPLIIFRVVMPPCDTPSLGRCRCLGSRRRRPFRGSDSWRKNVLFRKHMRWTTPTPKLLPVARRRTAAALLRTQPIKPYTSRSEVKPQG